MFVIASTLPDVQAAWGEGAAPGRLDLLGGVADYGGALVLEKPIGATTRVRVEALGEPALRFASHGFEPFSLEGDPARGCSDPNRSDEELRADLDELRVPPWVRYPLGCLLLLARDRKLDAPAGYAFRVDSDVPRNQGVSSSAALEVATLRALAALHRISFRGTELARLGQAAENRIVGAPCGLMDQLTACHGEPDAVLPILCRPDRLEPSVPLPRGLIVAGWPSGAERSVAGSAYRVARTATFMGKRIVERCARVERRFASELSPEDLDGATDDLPETMPGAGFLERFGPVDDPLAEVVPELDYPVRGAIRFPVEEHRRCERVLALLRQMTTRADPDALLEVGRALRASHEGYGAIGLGHADTDRIVDRLYEIGPERGIHGARTSGGGAGGTVVVLLERRALPTLEAHVRELFPSAGNRPTLIE